MMRIAWLFTLCAASLAQVVYASAGTALFFVAMSALEGRPDQAGVTLAAKFWPTLVANWAIWPLVRAPSRGAARLMGSCRARRVPHRMRGQPLCGRLLRAVQVPHPLACSWPPSRPLQAHLVNFRYVPSQWRLLYNNAVSIGWLALLSSISHSHGGALSALMAQLHALTGWH